MIMDGPSSKPKSSPIDVERLDLSFEAFNDPAVRGAFGAIISGGGNGGPGEAAFDDTLNTPRTATSDFNFNFIKSQLEFSQEAPPIIGQKIKFNYW